VPSLSRPHTAGELLFGYLLQVSSASITRFGVCLSRPLYAKLPIADYAWTAASDAHGAGGRSVAGTGERAAEES
jgi:hypothetical protein